MLLSYEAIYDHGQLTWISGAPDLARTRVIVTPIPERATGESLATAAQAQVVRNLPRKHLSDDEIERIMQETCGAWGQRTLEETEALIKQRRIEDWGEDERVQ